MPKKSRLYEEKIEPNIEKITNLIMEGMPIPEICKKHLGCGDSSFYSAYIEHPDLRQLVADTKKERRRKIKEAEAKEKQKKSAKRKEIMDKKVAESKKKQVKKACGGCQPSFAKHEEITDLLYGVDDKYKGKRIRVINRSNTPITHEPAVNIDALEKKINLTTQETKELNKAFQYFTKENRENTRLNDIRVEVKELKGYFGSQLKKIKIDCATEIKTFQKAVKQLQDTDIKYLSESLEEKITQNTEDVKKARQDIKSIVEKTVKEFVSKDTKVNKRIDLLAKNVQEMEEIYQFAGDIAEDFNGA
jgi:hypothetical protein